VWVAADLFGRCGYDGTSIAKLTTAADCNVAAVSHHFGGKAELYRAVWRDVFARVTAEHPADVAELASDEGALRTHVMALLRRAAGLGSAGMLFLLMRQELRRPTGLVDDLIPTLQAGERAALRALLSRLAPQVDAGQLDLFELGLLAQTRAVLPDASEAFEPLRSNLVDATFLARYADHITASTLAALSQAKGHAPRDEQL
jgi:AcrR family transcriptional regulator